MPEQADDEQDQEDDEKNLGYPGRCGCNTQKTENTRDDCNHKKY